MFEKYHFLNMNTNPFKITLINWGIVILRGYIKKSENIKLVDFILLHGVMY